MCRQSTYYVGWCRCQIAQEVASFSHLLYRVLCFCTECPVPGNRVTVPGRSLDSIGRDLRYLRWPNCLKSQTAIDRAIALVGTRTQLTNDPYPGFSRRRFPPKLLSASNLVTVSAPPGAVQGQQSETVQYSTGTVHASTVQYRDRNPRQAYISSCNFSRQAANKYLVLQLVCFHRQTITVATLSSVS